MTPALKLFEHLADFSEEPPLVVESRKEEFVPLIVPGQQQSEPDGNNDDPFSQAGAAEGTGDPFALEPTLSPPGDGTGSIALESDLAGLKTMIPDSGVDPFEPGPQVPTAVNGIGEPDADPFGSEPAGLAEEHNPFAANADPIGADALAPASDPLETRDDPIGPQVVLGTDADEMVPAEADSDIQSAESGIAPEIPSPPENDLDETAIDQSGIPADDPVFAEALNTFGEPPSENDLASLQAEAESLQENLADPGSAGAEAQSSETSQIQEAAESRIARDFATALVEAEEKMTELVCTSVAGILAGILNEELVRKSIEALAGRLREISGAGGALRIDVRGPVSLFEKLKIALGENVPELRYTEDNDPDLTIEIDSQIISSRIGEWRHSVEGCFS